MTPTRWQQIDQLLDAALAVTASERAAFVTHACNGDDELRGEVLALLAGSDQAEAFFEASPVAEMTAVLQRAEAAFAPDARIGPYRILRELGRGGMGLVVLAVRADDEYQKQVAIKLVAPNPLQPDLLHRFRRERQILADLEHPNIARLLDGGTTAQGWPYVVLEYVEGVPLTQFCRARALPLAERLRLFRDVCAAVQYAHQHLVIHRDLKPSNILVTASVAGEGVPKLLDFGIAKLLAPEQRQAGATRSGVLLMTPEYASPEQMRGGAITTASDVYSLGVLLYELLTGRLPYDLRGRTLPEIVRAVCEEEPMLPSAAAGAGERAALRGDLDNIALTALHKDPARRYRTVQQLSEDLRRHLAGEIVFARQATLGYRLQRFAQRNRGLVLAAALVLLSLLGGLAATWRQARVAQAQARANRRLAYAGQMHLAMQAWELANLGQLRELLEQSQPQPGEEDLRGFEWYHLWRLAYRHGERFSQAHPEEVWAVDFAPDGRRVASGCGDTKLRVWDAVTGRLLGEYGGHEGFIWDVAWSPDGRWLATAAGDGTARLWDAATGRELRAFKGHTHKWITAVAFAPDSQRLATSARDGTVRVWETATGRELLTIQGRASWVNALAWSPDGRWLATGHAAQPNLKLWDAATGRELRAWDNFGSGVWALAFAPDGRLLVSGHKDGGAHFLNPASGQEIAVIQAHRDELRAVAFTPDGKLLATASADRTIKLWDAQTRALRATLRGPTGPVWSLAFTPDGQSLVTGDAANHLKVWHLAEALAYDHDGQDLAAENSKAVFRPDSRVLAVLREKRIDQLELSTGRVLATSDTSSLGGVTAVVYVPAGARLFTGFVDGKVVAFATDGSVALRFQAHSKRIDALAFSADGQTLLTGSLDATVKLWRAATGAELATLKHPSLVRALALAPDGQWLAAGGHDNAVTLWSLATRQAVATWRGHTKPILTLAFAPDGRTLASGSADSTVKLWEVATGRALAVFKGPAGHVKALSFSPDGQRLATGSAEGLVRLWEVATQQEVSALQAGAGVVNAVSFAPNGQMLVSSSSDPLIRLWRAAAPVKGAASAGH